jgi:dolichol kinase
MRREISRKAFHLASVAVPLGVWWAPRPLAATVLVAAALLALFIDAARLRFRPARFHFLRRTRTMLRPHERRGLSGATYMALAYASAALLFPRPIAVVAMLYNGLGDAAAALIGRRFGRHRMRGGKSWEGFAAALVVNVGVGFAVPGIAPLPALVGGVAAAALELAPLPLDDNARVVLGGGLALWVAAVLTG